MSGRREVDTLTNTVCGLFFLIVMMNEYETCYLQILTLDYETAVSREDGIYDYTGSTA